MASYIRKAVDRLFFNVIKTPAMRRKKVSEPEVEAVPPMPAMKVVERREYTTPMPTAKPQEPQTVNVQATPIDEETSDDLLDFLAELEEEIGLSLRVDRLPQYSANGKWHKGATFEFCDNIPINKGDLKSGAYMSTIRDLFGPAAYRCTLREVGAGIIKSWPIKIAAPIAQPQQRQVGTSVIYQTQPQSNGEPAPPRDTLQELLDAGEKVGKLRKVFGWDHEAPQPTPMPIAPVVEPAPLQDRIVEAALNFALKTEKPETVAGLLQSYLNPRQDDFSWKEIIGEVVKPMIPMFMGLVSAYMHNQAVRAQQQAQAAQGQNGQGQQQALPPSSPASFQDSTMFHQPTQTAPPFQYWPEAGSVQTPPVQPGPTVMYPTMNMPQTTSAMALTEPEDTDEMAQDDLLEYLVGALQECVNRAASDPVVIEAGRREIAEFRARFPKLTQFVDMLASAPPVFVIGLLAGQFPTVAPLVNNPVAVRVIEDLQAALKKPEVEQ